MKTCSFFLFGAALLAAGRAQTATLETAFLRVVIDRQDGNFTLTHKESGKTWQPDPWADRAAGLLEVRTKRPTPLRINLSKSASIRVDRRSAQEAVIRFENFASEGGDVLRGFIEVELALAPEKPDLNITLRDFSCNDGQITRLEYPARHFSLIWEKDRGMAVMPYLQGVVTPSYRFPRPNSKFHSDDPQWLERRAVGELRLHGWEGLTMPWYGIFDDQCAVVTVIPENKCVRMQYIINYDNNQYWHTVRNTESQDPRILNLSPVWNMNPEARNQTIHLHFIRHGTHVEMAKYYRELSIQKGLFVSLAEKAKRQPGIEKMKGAVYFHLYGGYPHYVNYDDMDFTFGELAAMLLDLHDQRKVERAIVNIWGAYEKYPPVHLPYNVKAGGEAKLKEVYERAKDYGYLITNYHSWHAALEHDPDYNPDWIRKTAAGRRDFTFMRWGAVDRKLWLGFARQVMDKELSALQPNLFYSDGPQSPEVADYTSSFNLPVTIERGADSELFVKDYACLEGMAPLNTKNPDWPVIEAPLFNLVYHDAIFTTNRWQSPDNDYDLNGDFATRQLRNMLAGNLAMLVFPLWEYPGLRDMIEMINRTSAPWNREVGFAAMTGHDFLTKDLNVQRSRFANGAEVTVNFALCDHALPDGSSIPGYGFIMKFSDGSVRKGKFKTSVVIE